MNWKDKGSEALVGGLAGLGIVVLYLIAQAIFRGADAGDWLAFAGAIIGIGGATFTAIHVADRARRQARRDDVNLLKGALEDLDGTLDKFVAGAASSADKVTQKANIVALFEQLDLGGEVFYHARETSRIDDVTLWHAVRKVELAIEKNVKLIEREKAIVGNNEPSDEILRIHSENARLLAGELQPLLRAAVARIRALG